jgi:hypothetical protein
LTGRRKLWNGKTRTCDAALTFESLPLVSDVDILSSLRTWTYRDYTVGNVGPMGIIDYRLVSSSSCFQIYFVSCSRVSDMSLMTPSNDCRDYMAMAKRSTTRVLGFWHLSNPTLAFPQFKLHETGSLLSQGNCWLVTEGNCQVDLDDRSNTVRY